MGCEMSCDTYNDWPQERATRNQTMSYVRTNMELKFESAVENATKEMGYVALREKQKEAILAFLQGRDVFVSLCYSILPKTLKKKNAEVSPLL